MKSVTFKKDNEGWYADLPSNDREDNAMVAGADSLLDSISPEGNPITAYMSDNNEGNSFIIKLIQKSHDSEGATYIITGQEAKKLGIEGLSCWLCNVTHQIFGEHPLSIYIHDIS